MEVKFLQLNNEYPAVLEVLRQLRSNYDVSVLAEQIERQKASGYQIVYVTSAQGILAVAGFNTGEKLAWGKYLYIDELVTNHHFRSQGVGKFLLDWLKSYAKQLNCDQVHLDSGVQRFAAHKFYLREDFNIVSHHFSYHLD
ncbi:GNAT family N-acetyltransferase [Vibrio hippocampi]|uniref:N-acetyltransferase domain-containing protein n=1 Tax=Vibrio hippocampi TaxID=654686 RepID=A0ABN8DPN2_9VIBR|nr:GNAT family N-acetyltransferase [Vibrio hippocampi]CAH0530261.1 hypothetical protein VHP8226_03927 [Vibrio hippocampi]